MQTPPQSERKSLLVVRPNLGEGGADRVTVTLLGALDRTRVEPSLALFQRRGPYLDEVPADVPVHLLDASSLWSAWWPLTRYLRRARPDIVFSTCSGTNVVACLAHLLSGRRSRLVLSERNVLLRDQQPVKKWLLFAAKKQLYPLADCITAVSQGVADDLESQLEVDSASIQVVYNPIVGPELERQMAEPLDEPPFDREEPIVLGAGRLVPAKGFDTLLDAFAEANRATPANLVLLGSGPLRDELARQAERLGIRERVFLPGFVRNPFKYMARATVFVLSSRFEGLPGVLIQAMACGVPVISTRCPAGPEEIITDGRDGFLVPVDSSVDIARRLQRLLEQSDVRGRVGAAAARRAEAFRTDRVLDNYLQAILGAPVPEAFASREPAKGLNGRGSDSVARNENPRSDPRTV